jgi:hypothetical protein
MPGHTSPTPGPLAPARICPSRCVILTRAISRIKPFEALAKKSKGPEFKSDEGQTSLPIHPAFHHLETQLVGEIRKDGQFIFMRLTPRGWAPSPLTPRRGRPIRGRFRLKAVRSPGEAVHRSGLPTPP